jgi:hypothetical protein
MINALELYKRYVQPTEQPLKERGLPGAQDPTNQGVLSMFSLPVLADTVAPVGTYEDGSVGLAWPKVIAEPAARVKNALEAAFTGDQSYYFGDDGRLTDDAIMAGLDMGGLAMTGGLGAGLAGGLVDNAVGSAGGNLTQPQGIRAYRGVRDVSQRANAYFPPEATDDLAWWGSSNPDVANHYTKNAENSAVFPAEVRFKNPMELDLEGGHAGDVRYNGRRYVTEEMIPIARDLGHDGLIFKNVRDAARPQDVPLADTFAALRPGTVYSATTGDLLYANAPTGAVVPIGMEATDTDPALLEYLRQIGLY